MPAGIESGTDTVADCLFCSFGTATVPAVQPVGRSGMVTDPPARAPCCWLVTVTSTWLVRPAGAFAGAVTVSGAQTPASHSLSNFEKVIFA